MFSPDMSHMSGVIPLKVDEDNHRGRHSAFCAVLRQPMQLLATLICTHWPVGELHHQDLDDLTYDPDLFEVFFLFCVAHFLEQNELRI